MQREPQIQAAPGEDENIFMFVSDMNEPSRLELIADQAIKEGSSGGQSREDYWWKLDSITEKGMG